VITCPNCGLPSWRFAGFRQKLRENTVMFATCENCGKVFYIFRTQYDTYTILVEYAEISHGETPHLLVEDVDKD